MMLTKTIFVVTIIRLHFPSLLVPHKTLILRTYLIYFLLYENVSYLCFVFIFFANNYIGDRVFYLKAYKETCLPGLTQLLVQNSHQIIAERTQKKKHDALSAHEATNQQGLTETKLVSRANQNKYGKASNIVDRAVGTKSANQCYLL